MSEFSVIFQGVHAALDDNRAAANRLASAVDRVQSIRNGLTIEIRQRSGINRRLDAAARALKAQNASLRRMVTAGDNVCALYQRAENGLLGFSVGEITWVQPQVNPDYIPADGESSQSIFESLLDEILDLLPGLLPGLVPGAALPGDWADFDLLKIVDKLMDKLGATGGGMLGDVADYFESFFDFFGGDMSGLSGAADLANLADGSVGLWTGLYDLFKDLGAEGSLFSEKMAERVKGVGVLGSLLGTVGSFIDMMDTAGKTFEQILEDTADFGASGVKAGIATLKMIGSIGTLPAHIYTSIAEAGFDFVAQIGESIQKYGTDGWNLGDTGELLIDASCEGLHSLANALTLGGLDWILDKVTGNEDGDYGAMFSQSLKDGASEFAQWVVEAGQAAGELMDDAVDTVKETAENAWNGLVNAWNYVFG